MTNTKGITEEEFTFILKTKLKVDHQDDPIVVNFIRAYLINRDVKQTCLEIGIPRALGTKLRNQADINDAIVAITARSVMKYGYDSHEVIERTKEIATVDPITLMRPDGSYVTSLKELDAETRRSIKSFKVKNLYETDPNGMKKEVGVLVEVIFWDKLKAIELLGREKNLFKESKKIEHSLSKNMSSLLLESAKRAEERDVTISAQATPPLLGEAMSNVKDVTNE